MANSYKNHERNEEGEENYEEMDLFYDDNDIMRNGA